MNEDIGKSIKKLDYSILGCKPASVWKVYKNDKKIKVLIENTGLMTPARMFGIGNTKRPPKVPDYYLVVP